MCKVVAVEGRPNTGHCCTVQYSTVMYSNYTVQYSSQCTDSIVEPREYTRIRLLGDLWNNLRVDYLEQGESIKDSMKLWERSWRRLMRDYWFEYLSWSRMSLNLWVRTLGPTSSLAEVAVHQGGKRRSLIWWALLCNHSLLFTFHFGAQLDQQINLKDSQWKSHGKVCWMWGWNCLVNNPRSL